MHIAVDARPLVTRQISGAEQHARNVVGQWAASGHRDHHFYLLFDKSARENFDSSLLAKLPPNFEEVLVSSFHTRGGWLLASRVLSSLDRTLRRCRADVYHSFTSVVPRTSACPVVQTIHDLSVELDPVVRRTPEGTALRRLTRAGVHLASKVIAVSSQTKSDISSLYDVPGDKIEVVHNGINPVFKPAHNLAVREQLRAAAGVKPPYVLAVGADIPRRNYNRLFAAMQAVWPSHAELRWVLAGRADWAASPVYQRAKEANMLARMVFVASPTDDQLAQLYRDATLTVCASSFEGFGLSVLESLACGTPVACSDMRSLREVADEAAVYFPHDDPASMAEAVLGLIDDVEYRRQLKYRGVQRATSFTWAEAARRILSVLERAATGSSLPAATPPPPAADASPEAAGH